MNDNKSKLIEFLNQKKHIKTAEIALLLGVSRQAAHSLIVGLLKEGRVIKVGSTAKASYALPSYADSHLEIFPAHFHKQYRNADLDEDAVYSEIEQRLPQIKNLPRNIQQIFRYGFLEMMNNAIEHSRSRFVEAAVFFKGGNLCYSIQDSGIGIFKNVMKNKGLHSELEAIQDILKGKTTTAPEGHSGQGIFFTSKSVDIFTIESFGYNLIVNNKIDDVFLKDAKKERRGTKIALTIALDSKRELNDVFKKYTNIGEDSDYGFDRTEVKIKLYTREGIYLSRSQARRILVGLDKFESIIFDFKKVETVGQAFADEIFRVFHKRHPKIELITENMNEAVRFMVERVDK